VATKETPEGEETSAIVDPTIGEEVEVEIIDDTPAKDKGRKPLEAVVEDPTDEELEGYSDNVKKRIQKLTHARHDERRRADAVAREKAELENFAQRLIEENKALKKNHNSTQQVFAETTREKADGELAAAKAKLKAAHEAFDTDAIVEAQAELSQATLRAENAKNFKPTPLQEDGYELKTQQAQQQPVKPDQKSLDWHRENQWFGRAGDEDATSFALGLHQKLVNSGVDPRSEEYYEQLNARMKSKFPELFDDGEVDEEKPRSGRTSSKPPPQVTAPATRTTSVGKIRLTATQVALATKFGLTPQQYAQQVAKLEKESQNG
jgi:hypothetical protein